MLSPLVGPEGTITVVSPRGGGIRHYKSSLGFMLEQGDRIEIVAVAGVGSSALGTAALARNVADHFKRDVAGVITGYGMADVALEGLGGWFYYGGIDRLRYKMEQCVDESMTAAGSSFPSETRAYSTSDRGQRKGASARPRLPHGLIRCPRN